VWRYSESAGILAGRSEEMQDTTRRPYEKPSLVRQAVLPLVVAVQLSPATN
jgi:hypothetical protein